MQDGSAGNYRQLQLESILKHHKVSCVQVHIYLPELQHPAYGLVRAIVKDSTNNYTSPADANFLDSGECAVSSGIGLTCEPHKHWGMRSFSRSRNDGWVCMLQTGRSGPTTSATRPA